MEYNPKEAAEQKKDAFKDRVDYLTLQMKHTKRLVIYSKCHKFPAIRHNIYYREKDGDWEKVGMGLVCYECLVPVPRNGRNFEVLDNAPKDFGTILPALVNNGLAYGDMLFGWYVQRSSNGILAPLEGNRKGYRPVGGRAASSKEEKSADAYQPDPIELESE